MARVAVVKLIVSKHISVRHFQAIHDGLTRRRNLNSRRFGGRVLGVTMNIDSSVGIGGWCRSSYHRKSLHWGLRDVVAVAQLSICGCGTLLSAIIERSKFVLDITVLASE